MSPQPTLAMIAFYERRTREHIERVRRCLEAMAEATPYGQLSGSAGGAAVLGNAQILVVRVFDSRRKV